MTPGGHNSTRTPRSVLGGYVALMKLRVVELLLITTVPTMVLAEGGWPKFSLILITLLGGTLAAGGANAINMYIDRDIDRLMDRTANRPLVTGLIAPRNALVFACALEVVAFALLWATSNLLAAVLAVSATAFYVFIYTIWLKRTSTQNIVIGGAAGAAPPILGWAAVTNSIEPQALLLFLIIFIWTPPHFWALAIARRDEYARAGIPMLPVTHGIPYTRLQVLLYTVLLVLVALLPYLTRMSGLIYLGVALVLNGRFLYYALQLRLSDRSELPMKVFRFSITYLMWMFAALLVDHYLPTTQLPTPYPI